VCQAHVEPPWRRAVRAERPHSQRTPEQKRKAKGIFYM
jgi:hypothetical protein